jgi:signal transduction histidine kinase/CheY-like chemotaxis protein
LKTTDRPVAKLRRLFLHRTVPYALFVIGCTLALAAHWYISTSATSSAEMRQRSEFLTDAQQLRRQIQTGVNSYIEVVRAAAVLLSSETELNGAEVTRFVGRLQLRERYPAIEGIGFAQCVRSRDVNRVLRALALDGDRVRLWPDTQRAERCPVIFFDSAARRASRMRGFDLASNEGLRLAMAAARDSGQPTLSRQLPLEPAARENHPHTVVFIPVYRLTAPDSVEARRRSLVGYILSPFNPHRLLEHVVDLTAPSIALAVYDTEPGTTPVLLGGTEAAEAGALYESAEPVRVGEREWLVSVKSVGDGVSVVPEEARRALLGGLLLSVMLFLVTRAQARAWESAARHEAELRASAEALKEREAQASAANRAKDEFLATLSHELRTPLNVVLGWVGMLRHGALSTERAKQALEIIERNARQQAGLIDDLLDVSRIITGKLRLNLRTMEFGPIVSAVAESLRPSAEAKGVTLRVGTIAEPSTILGDPDRLRQTVWNLLSNAVKFTPPGGSISVDLTTQQRELCLVVRDTGVGIEPEFLPHVFERFRQADSTTTRTHGGVGLGLAIVRELIELHGGTVRAASNGSNLGAEFIVTIPTAAPAVRPSKVRSPARAMTPRLQGIHVLVVDDDPSTLDMLSEALHIGGAQVTSASSARGALECLDMAPPDVIVSDIAMPGEDGLWLIQQVRARPGRTAGTPAVALTALARKEDHMRALEAGFQKHMAKPVRLEDLQHAVATLAQQSTNTPATV